MMLILIGLLLLKLISNITCEQLNCNQVNPSPIKGVYVDKHGIHIFRDNLIITTDRNNNYKGYPSIINTNTSDYPSNYESLFKVDEEMWLLMPKNEVCIWSLIDGTRQGCWPVSEIFPSIEDKLGDKFVNISAATFVDHTFHLWQHRTHCNVLGAYCSNPVTRLWLTMITENGTLLSHKEVNEFMTPLFMAEAGLDVMIFYPEVWTTTNLKSFTESPLILNYHWKSTSPLIGCHQRPCFDSPIDGATSLSDGMTIIFMGPDYYYFKLESLKGEVEPPRPKKHQEKIGSINDVFPINEYDQQSVGQKIHQVVHIVKNMFNVDAVLRDDQNRLYYFNRDKFSLISFNDTTRISTLIRSNQTIASRWPDAPQNLDAAMMFEKSVILIKGNLLFIGPIDGGQGERRLIQGTIWKCPDSFYQTMSASIGIKSFRQFADYRKRLIEIEDDVPQKEKEPKKFWISKYYLLPLGIIVLVIYISFIYHADVIVRRCMRRPQQQHVQHQVVPAVAPLVQPLVPNNNNNNQDNNDADLLEAVVVANQPAPAAAARNSPQREPTHCPVCRLSYQELMDFGQVIVRTSCGHVMCEVCCNQVRNHSNTCPICRLEFTGPPLRIYL